MIKYEVEVYSDGSRYWNLNGKRHREDGPALELDDGSKYWYLNGKKITEAEHKLKTMTKHKQQTDIVEYIDAYFKGVQRDNGKSRLTDIIQYTDSYFKGVQSAQDEMKQKIEDKFQLWEQEGYVDKAVAASVIANLIR